MDNPVEKKYSNIHHNAIIIIITAYFTQNTCISHPFHTIYKLEAIELLAPEILYITILQYNNFNSNHD